MTQTDKQVEKGNKVRERLQKSILEKYDTATIENAKTRLCDNCRRQETCLLLPLTTTGEDCPYLHKTL